MALRFGHDKALRPPNVSGAGLCENIHFNRVVIKRTFSSLCTTREPVEDKGGAQGQGSGPSQRFKERA